MIYFDKTQLIIGHTYCCARSSPNHIILKLIGFKGEYGQIIANFIDALGKYRIDSLHCCDCGKNDKDFIEASSEQTKWLDDCILYNKALTFKESIALPKYQHYDIFS